MRQALADPVVFRGKGRSETRRSLASIGVGMVEAKRVTGPVP